MILLSIIVPVYNVRPYLALCLESLAQEVDARCEIILVDDASTDGSASQVTDFLKGKDSERWKLVSHSENLGLSAARNTGLSASVGQYIWFVDSDDALISGAVSRVLEFAPACDVVAFDYVDMYVKQGFQLGGVLPGIISNVQHLKFWATPKRSLPVGIHQADAFVVALSLLKDVRTYAWSFVCRRRLCEEAQFPNGRYYEDVATTPLWLLRASTIAYLPEALVAYRRRNGSITSVADPTHLIDLAQSYQSVIQELLVSDPKKYTTCSDLLLANWLQMLSWACRDLALGGHFKDKRIKRSIVSLIFDFRNRTRKSSTSILRYFIAARGRKEAIFASTLLFANLDAFIFIHCLIRNNRFRKFVLWKK